ncbi:MAG: YbjN domain-containing protein [Actinomycetota bacterium]
MTNEPASIEELDQLSSVIEAWMEEQAVANPVVATWERLPGSERRWFLRINGEEKDVSTIRWHLRQRTLHYETYFMPAPEENGERLYEHLLRRNLKMYGGQFAIGEEDALFIVGQLDRSMVDAVELDRVLGSMWSWIEQYFRPALRIGFASRFVAAAEPTTGSAADDPGQSSG